jgi:hypothetical protein
MYEAWATRNLTSDNFDMANNCKITGKPIIFCEQDCICRDRRNCSHPQWLTTRLNCGGTIVREFHHGDPDDSLAAYAVAASRALLNIMTGNPWTVIFMPAAFGFTTNVERSGLRWSRQCVSIQLVLNRIS